MIQAITVVARFRAKAGKEKELREVLLALVSPTRKEMGCVNYDLHESLREPGLFFFHENWSDEKSLARHLESTHVKSAQQKAGDLLADPLEIHSLKKL